jgi:hypothetical protein
MPEILRLNAIGLTYLKESDANGGCGPQKDLLGLETRIAVSDFKERTPTKGHLLHDALSAELVEDTG